MPFGVDAEVERQGELAGRRPEAAELADELAVGREDLDAMVVAVGDVHLAVRSDRDRGMRAVLDVGANEVELARLRSFLAPATYDRTVGRDLTDTVVRLGHVRVAIGPDGQRDRAIKLELGRVVVDRRS